MQLALFIFNRVKELEQEILTLKAENESLKKHQLQQNTTISGNATSKSRAFTGKGFDDFNRFQSLLSLRKIY